MANDRALREQLVELLESGHAHVTLEQAVKDFPVARAGERPAGSPHSGWELLEHVRIALHDIVEFSRSAEHVSPKFPEGYWPKSAGPGGAAEWAAAVRAIAADLAAFAGMLRDEKRDLYERFPWGDGQTLLREALVIADHNAYHLGQLVLVRRMLEG